MTGRSEDGPCVTRTVKWVSRHPEQHVSWACAEAQGCGRVDAHTWLPRDPKAQDLKEGAAGRDRRPQRGGRQVARAEDVWEVRCRVKPPTHMLWAWFSWGSCGKAAFCTCGTHLFHWKIQNEAQPLLSSFVTSFDSAPRETVGCRVWAPWSKDPPTPVPGTGVLLPTRVLSRCLRWGCEWPWSLLSRVVPLREIQSILLEKLVSHPA